MWSSYERRQVSCLALNEQHTAAQENEQLHGAPMQPQAILQNTG